MTKLEAAEISLTGLFGNVFFEGLVIKEHDGQWTTGVKCAASLLALPLHLVVAVVEAVATTIILLLVSILPNNNPPLMREIQSLLYQRVKDVGYWAFLPISAVVSNVALICFCSNKPSTNTSSS